jgi:hypothetical protein
MGRLKAARSVILTDQAFDPQLLVVGYIPGPPVHLDQPSRRNSPVPRNFRRRNCNDHQGSCYVLHFAFDIASNAAYFSGRYIYVNVVRTPWPSRIRLSPVRQLASLAKFARTWPKLSFDDTGIQTMYYLHPMPNGINFLCVQ